MKNKERNNFRIPRNDVWFNHIERIAAGGQEVFQVRQESPARELAWLYQIC